MNEKGHCVHDNSMHTSKHVNFSEPSTYYEQSVAMNGIVQDIESACLALSLFSDMTTDHKTRCAWGGIFNDN